jgi:hypothetical protein
MKQRVTVLVAVISSHVAMAGPAYPVEVVDRPQLLLPGMTMIDSATELPTYVNTIIDSSGQRMTTTTSLGDDRLSDLAVTHRFGPVEVTGEFDFYTVFGAVAFETGLPGVLSLSYAWRIPDVNSDQYDHTQAVGYSGKRIVMPHRVSIGYSATLSLGEYGGGTSNVTGLPISGHETRVGAGVGGTLQVTPNVAVGLGLGGNIPVEYTRDFMSRESVATSTQVVFAIHRLDVYAQFSVEGLTRTIHPFAAVGIAVRLGQPD